MFLIWCNFFLDAYNTGIYNFAKDFLVPIITIGGSVWGAFSVANRQIINEKNLIEYKKKEISDLFRLSYLTNINIVISDMKEYSSILSTELNNIDDLDYNFSFIKARSSGVYSLMNLNYSDLHDSFSSISLSDTNILSSFISSYRSVYNFKVDLDELNTVTRNYLTESKNLKYEISIQISDFLTCIKKIALDKTIDPALSQELLNELKPFYSEKNLKEQSISVFYQCTNRIFSIGNIHLNTNENVLSLVIIIKNLANKRTKLENDKVVYKSNIIYVLHNIDNSIKACNKLKEVFSSIS